MFSNDGTEVCSQIATQNGDVNILQQTWLQSSSTPQAKLYYGGRNLTYLQLVICTRSIACAITSFASTNSFGVAVGVDVFQKSVIRSSESLENANSIAGNLILKSFVPNFLSVYSRDLLGNLQNGFSPTTHSRSATGQGATITLDHWKELAPVNCRALRQKSHDVIMFTT